MSGMNIGQTLHHAILRAHSLDLKTRTRHSAVNSIDGPREKLKKPSLYEGCVQDTEDLAVKGEEFIAYFTRHHTVS